VIEELSGRELTATECAELVGLSPSAMSYHLRSLEKAGIRERRAQALARCLDHGQRQVWLRVAELGELGAAIGQVSVAAV